MNSFTTRSLNIKYAKNDPHKALQMPIYNTVAFEFDSAEDIAANFRGELPAHSYSRTGNPTVEYLELKMKTLCNCKHAIAMSSGMAAISTSVLALCQSGDNIISGVHLFGHTYTFLNQTIASFNIENRVVDFNNVNNIESQIDKKTRLIYIETVTNPQLEIIDIKKIAELAHRYGIPLIADSTLTPPNIFNSKSLNIDIEIISTTKYISGGANSVGGIVLDNGIYNWEQNPHLSDWFDKFGTNAFVSKMRKEMFRNLGPCMSAQAAHYQIQGLDILELRLERCYQNCLKLAHFFQSHEAVQNTNYPGLKTSPYYELVKTQFSGIPGTIMTFDLESEAACFKFMNKLQIIRRATNLNDNKTLIIHPWSTIYAEFSEAKRLEMGIRPGMLRLSVGIEAASDLITDMEQAL